MKKQTIPFEDPFNVSDDVVISLAEATFSDDFEDNIETSFIYLRNIEYDGDIDFSDLTYSQKAKILDVYLNRDIKDLSIEKLDMTLFAILLKEEILALPEYSEVCEKSILTKQECKQYYEEHSVTINQLLQLIISIPIFVMSLDKSQTIDTKFDVDNNDSDVVAYEAFCALSRHDLFDIIMLEPVLCDIEIPPAFFTKVFVYEDAEVADIARHTVFAQFYSSTIDALIDHKGSTSQLE